MLQSEKERIWRMILTIEVVKWIMLEISTLLRVDRCHADKSKISEDYYGCKMV